MYHSQMKKALKPITISSLFHHGETAFMILKMNWKKLAMAFQKLVHIAKAFFVGAKIEKSPNGKTFFRDLETTYSQVVGTCEQGRYK